MKTQLIGGHFTDLAENVIANGKLILELVSDEQLASSQGQACGGIKITISLDANGNINGTSPDGGSPQYVLATDQLNPRASYIGWVYTQEGQLAWGPNYNLRVPTVATFNINNWVPNAGFSGVKENA